MQQAGSRNTSIDIAKGMGILCIVLWHLQGVTGGEGCVLHFGRYFVNQFQVPFFFFISGAFFNDKEAWKPFLIKKIKRLFLPFVLANLFFLVVDLILHTIAGDAQSYISYFKWAIKICLGLSWTNIGGATWFLIALFRIAILYKLILGCLRLFNTRYLLIPLSIAISLCSIIAPQEYCISNTLYFYIFYSLGDISSDKIKTDSIFAGRYQYAAVIVPAAILAVTTVSNLPGSLSCCNLIKTTVSIIIALLGIILLLQSSRLINVSKIRSCLSYLGRNTMCILIWHFFAFKILVIVQVLSCGAETDYILAHPCYDVSSWHSLVYFAVGISFPLLISFWKESLTKKMAKAR